MSRKGTNTHGLESSHLEILVKQLIRQNEENLEEHKDIRDAIIEVNKSTMQAIQKLGESVHSKIEKLQFYSRPDKDMLWKIIASVSPVLAIAGVLVVQTINGEVNPVKESVRLHTESRSMHRTLTEQNSLFVPRGEFDIHLSEQKESEARLTHLIDKLRDDQTSGDKCSSN